MINIIYSVIFFIIFTLVVFQLGKLYGISKIEKIYEQSKRDDNDINQVKEENANHCVMCGEIIPEGTQVCVNCVEKL